MQRSKILKYITLFLAFVIPGVVFVFLKKFGRNEFTVEPLYQDVMPGREGCPPLAMGPYRIPETILKPLGWTPASGLILLSFTTDEQQMHRVTEAFSSAQLRLITVSATQDSEHQSAVFIPQDSLAYWSQCYLYLSEQKPLLLVDRERQIRGHYNNTREDVDRLLMEAAIILKKY